MTIAFTCVFLAFILNYVSKIPLAMAMAKDKGGYDNHYPRDQQARLTGFGKRALGAHLNGFEMFPPFAVSVIVAYLGHANEFKLELFCVAFIVSRLLYIGCYLADKATLRSTFWMIGVALIIANFSLPLFQ